MARGEQSAIPSSSLFHVATCPLTRRFARVLARVRQLDTRQPQYGHGHVGAVLGLLLPAPEIFLKHVNKLFSKL